MAKYTSIRDMFDGGGAGQSGDRFQGGGVVSGIANTLFNPLRGLPTDRGPEQSGRPIARPEGRRAGDFPPMGGGGSRGRNAPAGSTAPTDSARPVARDDVAALLNDVRGAGIYDNMAPVYGGNGNEPNPQATPEVQIEMQRSGPNRRPNNGNNGPKTYSGRGSKGMPDQSARNPIAAQRPVPPLAEAGDLGQEFFNTLTDDQFMAIQQSGPEMMQGAFDLWARTQRQNG